MSLHCRAEYDANEQRGGIVADRRMVSYPASSGAYCYCPKSSCASSSTTSKGSVVTALTSRLWSWFAGQIDRSVGWYRLPKPLGLAVLLGLRTQLRGHDLLVSGPGPPDQPAQAYPDDANRLTARMLNGTYNDHS